MVLRKPRRKTQSKDAELAVGALERPDPLDLEDVDLAPTMLGLDEAGEAEISPESRSSRPAKDGCIICGQPLCEECVDEDED
jgi:hypothetical protein